jgi:hypothetical protein
MPDYAFDKDFLPFLSEIPTVQDYSTAEKIQAMREMRAEAFAPAPPRDDVSMEDHHVPGVDGGPEILVRLYPGVFSQVIEGMESMLRLPGG